MYFLFYLAVLAMGFAPMAAMYTGALPPTAGSGILAIVAIVTMVAILFFLSFFLSLKG